MHSPPPPEIAPVQEQIAIALAMGSSIAAAARDASLSRQTIHNWLKDPLFAQLVQQLRADHVEAIRARLNLLSDRSLAALDRILSDPDTPHGVLLRAALAVLNRSAKTETGWALPMPIESPASAVIPDPDLTQPEPDLTQLDTSSSNSVSQTTETPQNPQIPRSAPCPCGSGEKYKRCCGRAAPPVLSAAA